MKKMTLTIFISLFSFNAFSDIEDREEFIIDEHRTSQINVSAPRDLIYGPISYLNEGEFEGEVLAVNCVEFVNSCIITFKPYGGTLLKELNLQIFKAYRSTRPVIELKWPVLGKALVAVERSGAVIVLYN